MKKQERNIEWKKQREEREERKKNLGYKRRQSSTILIDYSLESGEMFLFFSQRVFLLFGSNTG